MNEEIMINENLVEEIENDEAIVVCEEESGSSIGVKILKGVLVASVVGAVALAVKAKRNKQDNHESKLDAWRIKKLEKKGYLVTKVTPIEIIDDTIDDEDYSE